MKTIFDPTVREELIQRIQSLSEDHKPVWGKMNAAQMAKHNTIWNNWILGRTEIKYTHGLLGKIFGKMALKSNTKDNKPMAKNIPTGKEFKVTGDDIDFQSEIKSWMAQIDSFSNFSNDRFIHDFFGKMTEEQIGIFSYKHNDHHLRQFNV